MILLPLDAIDPFDPHHRKIAAEPGFEADEEEPGCHLAGARHCAALLAAGLAIRPIAVCAAGLVPLDRRSGPIGRPWQRLDGFKRYWGHRLAGRGEIACLVLDQYLPGAQGGEPMEADEWAR